jgi:hypothetical protein
MMAADIPQYLLNFLSVFGRNKIKKTSLFKKKSIF